MQGMAGPAFVISSAYDGKSRKLYPVSCPCGASFLAPAHRVKTRRHCSPKCRAEFSKRRAVVVCAWCVKEFELSASRKAKGVTGLKFCSRVCKDAAQRLGGLAAIQPPHYGLGNGKHDYRQRALEHYGEKCLACGYCAHPRMLDVDHMDGDRSNNALENLRVLCVWCHALKTRGVSTHVRSGI